MLKNGNKTFIDFQKGSTNINRIYNGEELIWERPSASSTPRRLFTSTQDDFSTTQQNPANGNLVKDWTNTELSIDTLSSPAYYDKWGNLYMGDKGFRKYDSLMNLVYKTPETFNSSLKYGSALTARVWVDKHLNIYLNIQLLNNHNTFNRNALIKYDSEFNIIWDIVSFGNKLTFDSNGDLYLTGSSSFKKLNKNNGSEIWSISVTGVPMDIEVDSNDEVIMCGERGLFGTDTIAAKYDSDGNQLYTLTRVTSDDWGATCIAISSNNNNFAIGFRPGGLPGFSSPNPSGKIGNIRRYNSDGSIRGTTSIGFSAYPRYIIADSIGGFIAGSIQFDVDLLTWRIPDSTGVTWTYERSLLYSIGLTHFPVTRKYWD